MLECLSLHVWNVHSLGCPATTTIRIGQMGKNVTERTTRTDRSRTPIADLNLSISLLLGMGGMNRLGAPQTLHCIVFVLGERFG
jgi:hypothetical protein